MDSRKVKNHRIQGSIFQVTCQLLLVLAVIGSMGCSRRYDDMPAYSPIPFGDYDNESVGRFKTSFLADQIDEYYRGTNPGPIGVTTLVNLDDLYNTSSFGRMYSEQLMSELTMKGYDVVELRHGDALQFLREGGEFALSRDTAAVRRSRELGGVVVGTYVVSPVRVYVNARLIDPATSVVLSAGSVEMSKTKEIAKLLRVGGFPSSLERIPVKHLSDGAAPLYGPNGKGWRYDWEESAGPYSRPGGEVRNFPAEPSFHEKPVAKPRAESKKAEPAPVGEAPAGEPSGS